ncbi:MAG: class SAM-dependent methyltransferase [Ramlibacter sp.]|nr:class SAM-dependent methyltransferase [Ramlibacter sp.]
MLNRFDAIYAANEWKHGSGEGSLPKNSVEYMSFLQTFLAERQIKSVVDMGSGDWQFSKHLDWTSIRYIGFDVAATVIARNQELYSKDNVTFCHYSGEPAELPSADLLIAKDVLQHLPNAGVTSFLQNLERFKYVLVTNCINPHGKTMNHDIDLGGFRYLDIRLPPFDIKATEVLRYSRQKNPIKRLLRHFEWTKVVLLIARGH